MARSKRFKDHRTASVTPSATNLPEEDEIEVVDKPEESDIPVPEEAKQEVRDDAHVIVEKDGDDPLEALRRQLEEVQAERDAQTQRARELEQRTRQQEEALQRNQYSELGYHKSVLEQAYAAEEFKLNEAKRRYASALERQDSHGAADALLEITRTDGTMRQYAGAYQEIEAREKAPRQAQAPAPYQDPFEVAVQQMDPRVAAWAREHKDDVLTRQNLALEGDRVAQSQGLRPGEDDYLDFMDNYMGYDAPAPAQRNGAANRSKRAPSAPVSRSSSGGSSRRVYLTEDDKRQARQLNMSEVQYAQFKVKSQEGQGGQQQGGIMHGRLHARYTASGN